MRNLLSCFLVFCFPVFLFCQVLDTARARVEVDSLIGLTRKLVEEQKFDEAIYAIEKAEEVALGVWGGKSAVYARCLVQHARIFSISGKYRNAEPLYLKGKEVWSNVVGQEHPEYLNCTKNLAALYKDMGEFDKAESLAIEVKYKLEQTSRKTSLDYALNLDNLANIYAAKNLTEQAEMLYLEVLLTWEKLPEKKFPDYANCVSNLATLYLNQGDFEKAEPLFLKIKNIYIEKNDRKSIFYGLVNNNLAVLYFNKGDYTKSEILYLETKEILEKTLGKMHPNYALTMHNIGTLYTEKGSYSTAERFHLEANDIWQKTLGDKHPYYAFGLDVLGNLYYYLKKYEAAEKLHLLAREIWEKVLGQNSPEYCESLLGSAIVLSEKGDFHKATSLFNEAKKGLKESLGEKHPMYASLLSNLFVHSVKIGDNTTASNCVLDITMSTNSRLQKSITYDSEKEISMFQKQFEEGFDALQSFQQIYPTADLADATYNNILFQKGFLQTTASKRNKLAQQDTTARKLDLELKSYLRRLAREYEKPIAERDSAQVADWEERANSLEKELTRTVAGYAELVRQVNWQEVQLKLHPGEAAIEFVHYKFSAPDPTDSTMYAALILRPMMRQPFFVPLFEEKELARLLDAMPTDGERQANFVADLYSKNRADGSKSLHELIWVPMGGLLAGTKKIYLSPSGLLHRVNFSAIETNARGQLLSDRFQIAQLNSTRQFLENQENKTSADDYALLFGGIQYETDSTVTDTLPSNLYASTRSSIYDFQYTDSTDRRGQSLQFLPGTAAEVDGIAPLFSKKKMRVEVLKGQSGSEASLLRAGIWGGRSPKILHLATHGFFFPDPKKQSRRRSFGDLDPYFKASDNPMLRSGLLLAGAQHAWQTGKPRLKNQPDGILTAYEVSQLDLRNTELVVLSACNTGLGQIVGNEGVYGLQRAFKIAGARYLLMSLWKVPDEATRDLMLIFYENYLPKKMSIPEAFHRSVTAMRAKNPNPYFWGAWVLVE